MKLFILLTMLLWSAYIVGTDGWGNLIWLWYGFGIVALVFYITADAFTSLKEILRGRGASHLHFHKHDTLMPMEPQRHPDPTRDETFPAILEQRRRRS